MGIYVNVDVAITMVGRVEFFFYIFIYYIINKIKEETHMNTTMTTIMVGVGLVEELWRVYSPTTVSVGLKQCIMFLGQKSPKGVRFPLFHQ